MSVFRLMPGFFYQAMLGSTEDFVIVLKKLVSLFIQPV